jgi:hypothetical protein
VFLFYYIWGISLFLVYKFKNVIEYVYLEFNHPLIIFKREFKDLGYFEKIFLIFFYKKGFFENSVANIFDKKNIYEYRKFKYPMIFFFHMYYGLADYKLNNLKLLVRQFNYYKNTDLFDSKLNWVKFKFFKKTLNSFIFFVILQRLFYNRYYNLCNSIFFDKQSYLNLIKLNWIFYVFLLRSCGKFIIYDVNKYSEWYKYNFQKNKLIKLNLSENSEKSNFLLQKFKGDRVSSLIKLLNFYNLNYKNFSNKLNIVYYNTYSFKFSFNNFSKIKVNVDWFKRLNSFFPVRFSESSVIKYVNYNYINNFIFLYLRKNRIFNKSRYSRNRQLYRTGVYWCLWLNIILVYGLYFLFYRFTFNFGYLWWGVMILVYSTIFSRALKYNFHNIYYLFNEFLNFMYWLGYIFLDLVLMLENFFYKVVLTTNIKNYLVNYKNYKFHFFLNNFVFHFVKFLLKWSENKNSVNFSFFWEGMKEKDSSFFKYKTIIHWFKQFYRMLIH